MKTTLQGVAAVILLLGCSSAASADVIEQVVTAPSTEIDVDTTLGNAGGKSSVNGFFSFNGFDPTSGTLTGITLTRGLTLTFSGTLTNTSEVSQTFTFSESTSIQISGQPSGVVSDPFTYAPDSFTSFTIASGASTVLPFVSSTSNSVKFPVSAGNYSSYENGPINFDIVTGSGDTVGQGASFYNGIRQQLTITGAGTYTLDYTYTPNAAPVPEPATILLLGAGLLGLAVNRKMQQRRV